MPGDEGARDDTVTARLHRNTNGFITEVDDAVVQVLGWSPDQLVGSPSTEFIHPDDQPSAVAAWMEMLSDPGRTHRWRGRYRDAHGDWVWVETRNTNMLEVEGQETVLTEMSAVDAAGLSLEEQLRAREEMLSQLADALPVGLVHFDVDHQIISTNDRLHAVVGQPRTAEVLDQFVDVVGEDRGKLAAAFDDVLGGTAIDDLELRLNVDRDRRVCSLSLRSLTDASEDVTGAIGCVLDVTERVRLRSELERRATIDALTGCANRSTIIDLLDLLLDAADLEPTGIGVIYIDIDDFKLVNDSYGHAFGDQVLAAAVQRLNGTLRGVDHVGRLGGDEFVAVCPGLEAPDMAREIAERVDRTLRGTFRAQGSTVELAASVGWAYEEERTTADELIARADQSMYEVKRTRRPAPDRADA